MEFAKISVILIGMDFPMLLGEAWNVIPSKCHLPLNGYSLAHVRTYHGMDIHMLGDYLEWAFHHQTLRTYRAWEFIPSPPPLFTPKNCPLLTPFFWPPH